MVRPRRSCGTCSASATSSFRRRRWTRRRAGRTSKNRNTMLVPMDRFDRIEELKDILKEVPLFRDLTVKQRYLLAEHGWEHTYPEGHALCQEGKRGDNFFV